MTQSELSVSVMVRFFGRAPIIAPLFAFIAAAITFIVEGSIGFSLADEGFLWYGVQRTSLGEIPIRDFTSYEPGRYYWIAAWARVLSDTGIGTVRLALYAFWAIGVMSSLLVIDARDWQSRWARISVWTTSTLILILWAHPRHKLIDISISMILLAVLSWVLMHPTVKRFFITGVCLGLTAFFGRNHALYGVIGLFLALLISNKPLNMLSPKRTSLALIIGSILGASPLILMSITVPGFLIAYFESIVAVLRLGQTNLPLPIPWPWALKNIDILSHNSLRQLCVSVLFVAILAIPFLNLIKLAASRKQLRREDAQLIAATSIAIPYAHFAFSRADLSHLAQAIHPSLVLVILIALRNQKARMTSLCIVTIISFVVCLRAHPYFQCIPQSRCSVFSISNQSLLIQRETASAITTLTSVYSKYGEDSRTFLVAPLWPGAYALFGKKAPMLWTYPLFTQTIEAQRAEISRIQNANPSFALLIDHPLNGLEHLRFRHTNPLIVAYLNDNYTLLQVPENPALNLYIPNNASLLHSKDLQTKGQPSSIF